MAASLPFPHPAFSGINWPWAGQPSGFLTRFPEPWESPTLCPNLDPAPAAAITYVGRAREARGETGAREASVPLCKEPSTALRTPEQALGRSR